MDILDVYLASIGKTREQMDTEIKKSVKDILRKKSTQIQGTPNKTKQRTLLSETVLHVSWVVLGMAVYHIIQAALKFFS